MKLHVGSIQKRGRLLYLVTRVDGKPRWVALKTGDVKTAHKRARRLLPPEDSEKAWLRHLSYVGARADRELRQMEAKASLTWKNLWGEFLSKARGAFSETSEASYERWMRILSESADDLGFSPDDILKKDSCSKIAAKLIGAYVSARRMLGFYRRVWRTIGLDPLAWELGLAERSLPCSGRREFYRRLSLSAIREVRDFLDKRNRNLADMVLIGYSTGLRLSDVAELEVAEVAPDARFLRIVPNKTRVKKPVPLWIPLTEQAREKILARKESPPADDGYLFPKETRRRPSRKIAAAFKSCGVLASGNGRASFHSLRATFISMMDEAGVPPHITDAITGHAGGGMHSRYTQPAPQAMIDAVTRAIPPL